MLCKFLSPASLDFHFGRTQIAARNNHSQFDMTLAYTSGSMVYSWKHYSVSPFKYESVYALRQSESTNSKARSNLCRVLVGCCMVFRGSGSRCGYCRFSRIVDTCRRPVMLMMSHYELHDDEPLGGIPLTPRVIVLYIPANRPAFFYQMSRVPLNHGNVPLFV